MGKSKFDLNLTNLYHMADKVEKRLALNGDRAPTDTEREIAKVINDLANSSSENREDFRSVMVSGVREFIVRVHGKAQEKKVYLVYVPFPSLKTAQKVYMKIVSEVQKRKHVQCFITAKRTILSRWIKTHKSQMRPRSRTLTACYDALLDDLLVPGNITYRRFRHKLNGKVIHKIWLNEENRGWLEDRVDAISQIYDVLTHRKIELAFKNEPKYYRVKRFKNN